MRWFRRSEEWDVGWTTIPYRYLKLLIFSVLLLLLTVVYFVFGLQLRRIYDALRRTTPSVAAVAGASLPSLTLADFDGQVRMRRSGSAEWFLPARDIALAGGDILQTDVRSMLRLVLPGAFQLTLDQNSVLQVDNNQALGATRKVKLRLLSGNLELATSELPASARPQLLLADAAVLPGAHSQARFSADGGAYTVVFLQGSGQVTRDPEIIDLENLESLMLAADDPHPIRRFEMPPPALITPEAGEWVFSECAKPLELAWNPVEDAAAYRVRVATDRYFSDLLLEKSVPSSPLRLRLPVGDYAWEVEAVGASGTTSLASSRHPFRLLCRERGRSEFVLVVSTVAPAGDRIELRGQTAPAAQLMLNDVPIKVGTSGEFHILTAPIQAGDSHLTLTAQDSQGRVAVERILLP